MTEAPKPKRKLNVRQRGKRLFREIAGSPEYEEGEGYRLLKFERDGAFDYELYKQMQVFANNAKIKRQWVQEPHIAVLAEYMTGQGNPGRSGLCHGTRRGNEQVWFAAHLPEGAAVIGTEIAETAAEFPQTIQWDFHEVKEEWLGATDFVYSNSWDHSYDPVKAFTAWGRCLAPGGHMFLDYDKDHDPSQVDCIDAFGVEAAVLVAMLNTELEAFGAVADVLTPADHPDLQCDVVVFRAKA